MRSPPKTHAYGKLSVNFGSGSTETTKLGIQNQKETCVIRCAQPTSDIFFQSRITQPSNANQLQLIFFRFFIFVFCFLIENTIYLCVNFIFRLKCMQNTGIKLAYQTLNCRSTSIKLPYHIINIYQLTRKI